MAKVKIKDFKLPSFEIPCPALKDFRDRTFLYREEDDSIFVRGVGNPTKANIMFVAACPMSEDVDEEYSFSDPSLLKAESTAYFKRLCLSKGIDLDKEYFTTLVKYALPRKLKLKPRAEDIKFCQDLLEEEIALVKPKVIVCLGKEAATYFLGLNTRLAQIEEAWLDSKKYNAKLYIIEDCQKSFFKPEYQDKMEKDIQVLAKHYEYLCEGRSYLNNIPQDYKLIQTKKDLINWIDQMKQENIKLFAVDCEWGGMNFVDGTLRSIQFCWAPGKAVFIHFHNEELKWNFDAPKEEIYKIISDYFNDKSIKFLGHNIAADYQWMSKHIGIDIHEDRCWVDTMFGLQTADEYADLKLEKLAAKYTDLGRYDIDLLLWKKENKGVKFNEDEGYGSIPTEILFPYGCKDVDTTFRMASIVEDMLKKDNTWDYYRNIKNPFVTDEFAEMSMFGAPFNMDIANKIRLSYLICKYLMKKEFDKLLKEESKELLFKSVTANLYDPTLLGKFLTEVYPKLLELNDYDAAIKLLKPFLKTKIKEVIPALKHFINIDSFNYMSAPCKQAWLFDVKKYTPVKSTKALTGSSVDWDKVIKKGLEKEYTPAVDKDTLKIYATAGDKLCLHILQMSAVETITKTFLKGEEGGLQKFIASDGRLHTNYVLTESSRPRTFKPNILNIPRYVTDYIKQAFKKAYSELNISYNKEKDCLDFSNANLDLFNSLVNEFKKEYNIDQTISLEEFKPYGIRECFRVPDNKWLIDADYATAEVFAIAYLANDKRLISTLTEPDPQFALKKMPDGSEKSVRIAYIDDIVQFSEKAKDKSLLHDPNDPDLLRDEKGNLKHPKQDVHWMAVENEFLMDTPREKLDKNKTRDAAGKISNFSIPYGTSPELLERQVELASGEKPPKGTGQKMIDSYMKTKPDVAKFLEKCKQSVFNPGYYQAPSGYKRHYSPVIPDVNSGLSDYQRDKIIQSTQRQACNIPLQNLVADSLARSVVMMHRYCRQHNLKTRIFMPLYDCNYCEVPKEEILIIEKLIVDCMSTNNYWDLPGGRLAFTAEPEIGKACGTKLTKSEKEQLERDIETLKNE